MRILVITPFFYPHPGGSQRYIEELYASLRQLQPQLEVDILCYNTDQMPLYEKYRGFHIYRVPAWEILPGQFALPNPVALLKLLRQLKTQFHYDVVNAHTRFFESSWWAPWAANYLDAISILTDHCAARPSHNFFLVNWVTTLIDRLLVPVVARQYDQITVVSQATKQYLRQLGVKVDQVIYPGIDSQLFPAKSKLAPSKITTISFVGRFIPSKGVEVFLQSMVKLIEQSPKLRIVAAGDGPLLAGLKAKYTQPEIQFPGRLSAVQVAKLLQKTDIFVLPSTHHEGFPITLLEAGAAGCAIITTDRGGTTELITSGKSGLIILPTETELLQAVQKLLTEPAFRQELATTLQDRVLTKFTWLTSAKAFAKLLRVTVEARKNR